MKYLFTTLIIPVAFFLLLETCLWLVGIPVFTGTDQGRVLSGFQDCRYHPDDLDKICRLKVDPGEKVKIFAFGESTVEGFGLTVEKRFTSLLQKELDLKHPGKYFVGNFGRGCKDSFFVRECVKRLAHHQPEFVIVYAGHNDYINLFHPKNVSRIFRKHAFLARLLLFLRRNSRLYTVMSQAILPPDKEEPYPFRSKDQYERRHAFLITQYQENLNKIREIVVGSNGSLLLMTPASNLIDFKTKDRKYHEPLFIDLMNASWQNVDEGLAAFKVGRFQEADRLFRKAKDADPVPSRVTERFNDELRAFAGKYPAVTLVDFAKTVESLYLQKGIGCNLFGDDKYCDQFHPNESGHRLMADILLEEILKRP